MITQNLTPSTNVIDLRTISDAMPDLLVQHDIQALAMPAMITSDFLAGFTIASGLILAACLVLLMKGKF